MGCPVCGSGNAVMTRHGDYKCLSCGWKEGNMSPEEYRREMLCPQGGAHDFWMVSNYKQRCKKCGHTRAT